MFGRLIFMLALSFAMSAHADHPGLSALNVRAPAINIAAETRMLSQRVAKSYVQIGLGVMPAVSAMQLQEAITRFERNLELLRPIVAGSPNAERALGELAEVWGQYLVITYAPVSQATALALSRKSNEVLDSAERLMAVLQTGSSTSIGEIISRAGRLRMHSQRMAKVFMLLSWGLRDPEIQQEFDRVRGECVRELAWLMGRPENTPEILVELEEVKLQMALLHQVSDVEAGIFFRLMVAQGADSILAAIDHAVSLYGKLESN